MQPLTDRLARNRKPQGWLRVGAWDCEQGSEGQADEYPQAQLHPSVPAADRMEEVPPQLETQGSGLASPSYARRSGADKLLTQAALAACSLSQWQTKRPRFRDLS